MSTAILRFAALYSILLLVAGCGGSSTGGTGGGGGGGNNATTVTVAFSGATPTAVATRIGSGSFASAALSSGGVSISLPSGTTGFGVAYVCPAQTQVVGLTSEQVTSQVVAEGTTADGTSFTLTCPSTPAAGATGTLTGSVDASAIPGTTFLNIDAQNGSSLLTDYSNLLVDSFSFSAPAGSDRVDVLAYQMTLNGFELSASLTAIKTFTGQAVPGALNGGSTVVLTAADATTPEPVTFINPPPGFGTPTIQASFQHSGGKFGTLLAAGNLTSYPAMPAGVVNSGDTYFVEAEANDTGTGSAVATVSTLSAAAPLSVTFPPAWAYSGPAPAALPTMDFVYSGFAGKSGVVQLGMLTWSPAAAAMSRYQMMATANYQNGATSLTFPGLSGIPGFLAAPPSAAQVDWSASIFESSSGFANTPPAGSTLSLVLNGGVYLVP